MTESLNAVWRSPQVWTGHFPDGLNPSVVVASVAPPAGERPGVVKALSEVKQRELARRTDIACRPDYRPQDQRSGDR